MAGKRIFINYRRSDTGGHAGRLYDYLKNYFGSERVFFDVDTIAPGVDFAQKINRELDQSGVVLALIGKQWLDARDSAGNRRLDDPQDYVRLEVESALKKNVTVVPVLLQGATIPTAKALPEALSELSRRNAIRLDDDQWGSDLKLLTMTLNNTLGRAGSLKEQRINRYKQIVVFLSLAGAILAIVRQFFFPGNSTASGVLLKLLLSIALGLNVPFIAFLLGSMKQKIDRLGWVIVVLAVLGSILTAWGGNLTIVAAITMVLVAGLLNFTQSDE